MWDVSSFHLHPCRAGSRQSFTSAAAAVLLSPHKKGVWCSMPCAAWTEWEVEMEE